MNKKMNIKMICSDLDDTLLFDAETLSNKSSEVLRKALADGILFVPATGRHYACIPDCVKALPGLRFEISSNGALIRDILMESIIFSAYFNNEALSFLMDITKETGKPFEIYQQDRIIMDCKAYEDLRKNPASRPYILKCFGDSVLVPNIEETLKKDSAGIHKFLIRNLSESLFYELFERVNRSGLAEASSSLSGNLEISPCKINKGNAMLYLCGYLGFSPEETAAFGDGINDIAMLDIAGISAAVMNASDEVKAHADYIVADNKHDGPARFIENNFFIGLT